jgi:hypothetical protein
LALETAVLLAKMTSAAASPAALGTQRPATRWLVAERRWGRDDTSGRARRASRCGAPCGPGRTRTAACWGPRVRRR